MASIQIPSFRGEAPRLSPEYLQANGAQVAINCRLQSGNLECWRHFSLRKTLTHGADVKTIFKLRGLWLSWEAQVDIARSLIAGDTTDRIYLTSPGLYATPRWTNYDLATGSGVGAEPYPIATRPLGVPNPTVAPTLVIGQATTPDITVTDDGDQGASWIASGSVTVGTTVSSAAQDNAVGNPLPSYRLAFANNSGAPAGFIRDFGVQDSQTISFTAEFAPISNGATLQAEFRLCNDVNGAGIHIAVGYPNGAGGGLFMTLGTAASLLPDGARPSYLEQVAIAALDGTGATWYRMEMTLTRQANGTSAVVANLFSGATLLGTVDLTARFNVGGYCGFSGFTDFTPQMVTRYDNITVVGSGTFDVIQVGTVYVYTYVNDVGEPSGPSPVSETILRPDGSAVTVTTPTAQPAGGYVVTTKRIYRAATGSGGSVYVFVAEIPLAQADYVDELDDSEIGPDVLETADSDLPPPTLEGILALPNGIMCGFFENMLCFSLAGYPHSWPVKYRLPACSKIVAIKNIDNTVVIGTTTQVQTATGNDPSSYSMSEPGEPQSCTSKLGMRYVDGIGVMFPSPDGYQVCRGSAGAVDNVTAGIFTKDQWAELDPTTIIAAVHDRVLHFWFTGSTPDGGYAIDAKQDGFGLIRLSYYATAAWTDLSDDGLHLVLKVFSEPTDALLPIQPTFTLPGGPAIRIYQFNSDPAVDLTYRWRGKLNLLPYPLAMQWAKIRASGYTNLVASFIGDGTTRLKRVMSSLLNFRVRPQDAPPDNQYEIEFIGTSRVRTAQVAEDVEELV